MLTLQLNLDGSNRDNIKTKTYPIRTGVTNTEAGVYVFHHGIAHTKDLVVRHVDTNSVLVKDRDFYLTYYSQHLKHNYNVDGFGGLVLTNKNLTGNLEITANFVGGGYVRYNPDYVVEIVKLVNGVPEQLFWDMVLDAPSTANPNGHKFPAENIATGYQDLVAVQWMLTREIKAFVELKAHDVLPCGIVLETNATPGYHDVNKYWIELKGQTIARDDYPFLFIALGIDPEINFYTVENRPGFIMRAI